jgi:hypothetical protein
MMALSVMAQLEPGQADYPNIQVIPIPQAQILT